MQRKPEISVCRIKETVSFISIQNSTHQMALILAQLVLMTFCCGNVGLQLGGGVICVALPWRTGGH